jgi:hypothetical protein
MTVRISENRTDLQSIYELNSVWAERTGYLVLVGIVIDILAAFTFKRSAWEVSLTVISNCLIAGGVWGGIIFEKRAKQAGDGIVALANARAAEADQKAEEARLELIRLTTPRSLSFEQQRRIADGVRPFDGVHAVLGAIPASAKNVELLQQISQALEDAGVDAFINLRGVDAAMNPAHGSHYDAASDSRLPSGVHIHFVAGNSRGKAFAETLAAALTAEGVVASSFPDNISDGRVEHWVKNAAREGEILTRESPEFEHVTVVVADKP